MMQNQGQMGAWIVEKLVKALEEFCQDHEISEFPSDVSVRFAIAFQDRATYTWTPMSSQFYRIVTRGRPDSHGRIALVFGYDMRVLESLTQELHERFVRATDGQFLQTGSVPNREGPDIFPQISW